MIHRQASRLPALPRGHALLCLLCLNDLLHYLFLVHPSSLSQIALGAKCLPVQHIGFAAPGIWCSVVCMPITPKWMTAHRALSTASKPQRYSLPRVEAPTLCHTLLCSVSSRLRLIHYRNQYLVFGGINACLFRARAPATAPPQQNPEKYLQTAPFRIIKVSLSPSHSRCARVGLAPIGISTQINTCGFTVEKWNQLWSQSECSERESSKLK